MHMRVILTGIDSAVWSFGPREAEGPIRYPLYVCLYVCMSQLPSLNHAYKFSDFWHEGRGPLVKKSDRARFARKIQNWGFLGHLGSKMAQKWTLCHIA